VASPILQAYVSRNATRRYSRSFAERKDAPHSTTGSPAVTALSVEFVAKPQETHGLQTAIPAALAGAFQDVSGFAGCLVMVSEQEARLVNVITLWVGNDRQKLCRENARWVQKLLTPYLDRCLRAQTLAAHTPSLPMRGLELSFEEEYSTGHFLDTKDETACVVLRI
jgi:hypothetical protein